MKTAMKTSEIDDLAATMAASKAVYHPDYLKLAARIEVSNLHSNTTDNIVDLWRQMASHLHFHEPCPLIDPAIVPFVEQHADALQAALDFDRDFDISYFGLKTLQRAYLVKTHAKQIIERPGMMWMRVAIGLHQPDLEKTIETYHMLSKLEATHATPTLFNASTTRPQLSSCFLLSMKDDSIEGIFDTLKQCALISKYAGGIGIACSNVRSKGSYIKGTNGTSNGIAPMLRVFNNCARYVDQCVLPNTIVYAANGPTEIQYLANGDGIMHAKGREPITNVLEHHYTGPMLKLHTMHSVEPLTITPEHPVYALRDLGKAYNYTLTKNRIANGMNVPAWIDASELRERDFIGFPIPTYEKDVATITPDDCYFYGVVLGDGYLEQNKSYGYVSLHTENKTHIQEWLIQYFNNKYINYTIKVDENTTIIRWCKSTVMPVKYGDVYDATKTKRVHPKWLHLPLEKAKYITKGLMDTDGSCGKEIMFDSTSRNLIESLRYLCLRMGVLTSGYIRDRRGQTHMTKKGYTITNQKISYCLRIPKVASVCELLQLPLGHFQKYFEYDGMLFSRIQRIEETHHDGTVYDLQLQDDHTYITHNGLVHNGGGRRKGSFAIYLEPWHACIYDFLELKLPGGKMEARALDLFYGLWICDLFMQRVQDDSDWSLLCPHECPGLTTTYGDEFDILYTTYEAMPEKVKRKVKARDLWFKILTAQVESGTPYMLYKDAVNRKSNQKNIGVIKSSNLCTEITLYTDENEVAVCNLASICLPKMLNDENQMNYSKLGRIVEILTRNLDNVIDRNFYPIEEAKTSNLRHRPIGIGIQGLADVFMLQRLPFESKQALELSDDIMACIYYHALKASCQLAKERGKYKTFEGSPASKGILQYDMWEKTEEVEQGKDRYDWQELKKDIMMYGLRNSMLLSPMPTASTAQICGNTEGIEPLSSNLYTRHTLAGNFVVVNEFLVNDLIDRNLWNAQMQAELIKSKGSVQHIAGIPEELKQLYKTTWEIKQRFVIDHAAARGKYICQSQSLNLYFPQPTANTLSSAHFYAWKQGLKTGMYYLRAKPASESLNFSQEEECESCGS